jgi:hypothetical protein
MQNILGTIHYLIVDKSLKAVKEYDGMVKVSRVTGTRVIRRFGHATAQLGTGQAVCVGGFGEQEGKHMRVTDIVLVDSVTMAIKVINPCVDNRLIEGR